MSSNIIREKINTAEALKKIDPDKVQFLFLGEDDVWFRAYSLCEGLSLCYVVTIDVEEEAAERARTEIASACTWRSYYLGMGHVAYMREKYYPDFWYFVTQADCPYRAAYKVVDRLLQFGPDKARREEIIKGVVYGHAVGDAVGVPVEFFEREELQKNPVTKEFRRHPFLVLPKGCWSDDTSMALCTLDSLAKGGIDFEDVLKNFAKWYSEAAFTPTGYTFDVGMICAKAIEKYMAGTPATLCGGKDEYDNGNGSLMRIYPFVLYLFGDEMPIKEKLAIVHQASALTHAHRRSQIACGIYAFVLWEIMTKRNLQSAWDGLAAALDYYREEEELIHFLPYLYDLDKKRAEDIPSSGYVVDTLVAALWCLFNTDNYTSCILTAVNLGGDTDTIAAVAGSLAGALYGYGSIPADWKNALVGKEKIDAVCADFLDGYQKNYTSIKDTHTCEDKDVTAIKDIKLHRTTPTCRHTWYELVVTLHGEDCECIYTSQSLGYLQKKGGDRLPLSAELATRLQSLTGESGTQRRTRTLMGLDTFLYGKPDWSSSLSSAALDAHLRNYSKVTFKMLQDLPDHWLSLLPVSVLYDWLHCIGGGDEKERAFVDEIAAKRKQSKTRPW